MHPAAARSPHDPATPLTTRNTYVTLSYMDLVDVLADPTRRAILDTLRAGPLGAGEIASRFPVSRPAISRHLRVLLGAGLVSVEADGRRRRYRLDPRPLAELDAWLTPYRDLWDGRLDALGTEVYRTRRGRRAEAVPPDNSEGKRPA